MKKLINTLAFVMSLAALALIGVHLMEVREKKHYRGYHATNAVRRCDNCIPAQIKEMKESFEK